MMHLHKMEQYDEDEVRDYVNDTRRLAGCPKEPDFEDVIRIKLDCLKDVLSNLNKYDCDTKSKAVVQGMIDGVRKAWEVLA